METKPLERKLVAILYADVAGYSRLTGEDEEGTHRALSAYLDTLTTSIERHNGKVLHYAGDAVLADFKINSQAFMAAVAKEISRALHNLMLDGIQYEKVAGQHWEMSRIEQEAEEGIVRYLSNLYQVQNKDKALFDAIEYESEVEKQFAMDLDNNENVRLFVKLPGWFKITHPSAPTTPTGRS